MTEALIPRMICFIIWPASIGHGSRPPTRGQGELTLNNYNGGAIAATDGVLYIQLIGENIITANAPAVLSVSGENTGLHICGGAYATENLRIYSTYSDTNMNTAWGIDVTVSNSATIPFSLKDMRLTIDMSMVEGWELASGRFLYRTTGGIQVLQTVRNAAIVGIDMAMDNSIITVSGGGEHTNFYYGMWQTRITVLSRLFSTAVPSIYQAS